MLTNVRELLSMVAITATWREPIAKSSARKLEGIRETEHCRHYELTSFDIMKTPDEEFNVSFCET
jgi:hypothetical protein